MSDNPQLTRSFTGQVYRPGDEGYDGARQPLNPAIDPWPADNVLGLNHNIPPAPAGAASVSEVA
jgi:hypothetical protein